MKRTLVALLAVGLVGCASVKMGDAAQDQSLKSFNAPPGKAGVFIYRNETFGAAVKMDVELDGQPLGQTAAKTYLYKEVAPGTHTVVAKAENSDSVQLDAKPGTLYYIWQEVKMGLMAARTKLHLVGDEEGKKGVMESKLAETK